MTWMTAVIDVGMEIYASHLPCFQPRYFHLPRFSIQYQLNQLLNVAGIVQLCSFWHQCLDDDCIRQRKIKKKAWEKCFQRIMLKRLASMAAIKLRSTSKNDGLLTESNKLMVQQHSKNDFYFSFFVCVELRVNCVDLTDFRTLAACVLESLKEKI